MTIEMKSADVAETMMIGRRLAALARPGDVVVLAGPLGSGKTAFVGGLAEGLGIDDPITSPSFVLMRRYDSGFTPLVHVDVYRLGSLGEFEDLEVFEEGRDGVTVIEWGNAVAPALPPDHLTIELIPVSENERTVRLGPCGDWEGRPLEELVV